ncbi:MAG: AmmeMemoRadiSam system protein B [Omnitrophica WOR_2 bacterium]
MQTSTDIRPSPIAGKWYPGDANRLASSIDSYLNSAILPPLQGEVVAVMSPHAGHQYCGPVAGFAFAALRGLNPEVVAVVSPMHYPYPQPLLTTAHRAYSTPLGEVPVDQDALTALDARLEDSLGFGLAGVRNDPEHSLEIELPFLQRALSAPYKLLPVMVRDQSPSVSMALGHALAQVLKDLRSILVASTDLSHFFSQDVANALDDVLLKQVADFNPQGVLDIEEQGKGFACGKGALAAVLWAAKDLGADRVQILQHATSGDVTGDYTQVVGYGAAVIVRSHP